jgi:hypothetical protein
LTPFSRADSIILSGSKELGQISTRNTSMWRYARGFAVLALVALAGPAQADEAGATKYLEQAKTQAADKEIADRVETTLKLAEAELDGVDPAKKAVIVQGIAPLPNSAPRNDRVQTPAEQSDWCFDPRAQLGVR